ncbi:TPA: tail fiber protein, partial [Pasteurella multocida]|nr:tail fiber protein [Pasteurella multocida]
MYALDNDSGVQTMPEVKAKKFNHTEPRWFTEGGNGVAPSYPG